MKNKIVACVAACLLAATANGEDTFERACRSPQVVLAHINGVLTSELEAKAQLEKYIQPSVQFEYQTLGLDQRPTLEFKLLYNYTQGLLDFFEAFNQRMQGTTLADRIELAWGARDKGGTTTFWSTIWNGFVSIFKSLEAIVQWFEIEILGIVSKVFGATASLFTNSGDLQKKLQGTF